MAGFGSASPFEGARARITQRTTADAQQGDDAIKRRFAAQGALNSGAAIKAQQTNQENALARREEAMRGVDDAESQDTIRRQDVQEGRTFESDQAKLAREFQSGEAEKGRGFQREQSGIDRAFQDKVFAFDSASKLRQMDLADRQFSLSKDESEFNKRLARHQAGQSGGLFGGGGFLGTGIGAKDADI